MLAHLAVACQAANLRIDYSQDGSGFFSASTSQGQQARAALNAAADYYSGILTDSLAPVSVPARFYGGGGGTGDIFLEFADPNDPTNQNAAVKLDQFTIAQNEYVVFAGGAPLSGSTGKQIASAGLGWSNYQYSLLPADIATFVQSYDDFVSSYKSRGQASGFAHWGGTISFDNDGTTDWHLDLNSAPSTGESDLYSVALHELGHVLGFGGSSLSNLGLVNAAGNFVGAAAVEAFGAPVPMQSGGGHWAEGTMSVAIDTGATQETLYDPSFNGSVRKELTMLDAAGLSDLGWSVGLPALVAGDFNGDLRTNAADYTVWREGLRSPYPASDYKVWAENYGQAGPSLAPTAAPSPGGGALLLSLATAALLRRS
ncbi:matrixin family metalloprotease [Posidoniimonas polymericola]|uniref:matrixin family metalloprotease n=1 Tax=Posidoniimonas polymericola TaxID=2528002 RepID=UPI0011B48FCE|nr:matrixin family metalloprotease [Posidoniimonas polymericola]